MPAVLVGGALYAVGGAVTMTVVLRVLRDPDDTRLAERVGTVTDVLGGGKIARVFLLTSMVVYWPMVAWILRTGSLPPDTQR